MNHHIKKMFQEYNKACESQDYHKQYDIIRICVKNAVDEWINENPQFLERYGLESFYMLDVCITNSINYYTINSLPYNQITIAQSLWHECIDAALDTYDTFDEDFSSESCLKVAEKIFVNLLDSLNEDKRFFLPVHLQAIHEKYCSCCGVEWTKDTDTSSGFFQCEKCGANILNPLNKICSVCGGDCTKKSEHFLKCEKCKMLKPTKRDDNIIVLTKGYTTINCWLDFLPLFASAGEKTLCANIEASGSDNFIYKKVALEYSSPMHHNCYGLLGFEFTQDVSLNSLEIEVKYIDDHPFDRERCNQYFEERVTDGIEEYYSKAILDEAILQFKGKETIPAGRFVFCKGKTGEVRSSPKRFQFLTKMLIDIFYDKEQIDDKKLSELKELADIYIRQ